MGVFWILLVLLICIIISAIIFKKRKKKLLLVISMVFAVIFGLLFLFATFVSMIFISPPLSKYQTAVRKTVGRAYNGYEIDNITLQYTDWSNTVREATEADDRPTKAAVRISKDDDIRELHLIRPYAFNLDVGTWEIINDVPVSGSGMPNEEYYSECEYHSVGKAVDIEKYCKNVWAIPQKDGSIYKISGKEDENDEDWYYSVLICDALFKVSGNEIYEYTEKTRDWTLSDITYPELDYYSNYDKVTKEEVENLLNYLHEEKK